MTTQSLSRTAPAAPSTARVLANLVAFQIGWFACVLGGAYGQPWAGTAVALTIAVVHLASAARPGSEARLLALATGLGAVWDSALVALGWLSYSSGVLLPGTAPVWIVAMWTLFATTLNLSLNWLKNRHALAAVFGALGGPLAYYSGMKLGAVSFPDIITTMAALALGWALIMPVLMVLAQRFDGINPAART
jgi:hypothetical protein